MDNQSSSQSEDISDAQADNENTMSILIATDNHIGYLEKDPERGGDSLVTFEEILQIAQEKKVDFILLGGDLFHENKPSRKIVHKTMELLRKYCMGDRPCFLEFLSEQSINFASNSFPTVNYEDPNYNISIPVFSIHGNHDDPAGDGNLCTLNLLSVNGLVNYFGKATNVDDITVNPILIQKGSTKLALYGLGSVRDERLHRTFVNKKVRMLRPKEDAESWFNCFVLHQNRAKHGLKNYIPEKFLDEFLDLVIWGHEHECIIDPHWSESEKDIYICQPGSSVATSLCEGESKPKHIGILKILGKNFRIDKIRLKTVRPFYIKDVILNETDLQPTDEQGVQGYLSQQDVEVNRLIMQQRAFSAFLNNCPAQSKFTCKDHYHQVEKLIEQSVQDHNGERRQPKLPLIRIRVEYSGGFSAFNVNRFGQQFAERVANTKDILSFFRKKVPVVREKRSDDGGTVRIRPEILDDVRVEELVNEFLNSEENKLQLSLLSEHKMALALQEFVDKDEKEAIGQIVKLQLHDTQKILSTRQIRDEEIVEEVIKETERSRAEEPSQEEKVRTRQILEEAIRESQSRRSREPSPESDGSDEGTGTQISKPTRGRGRGRARGSRGQSRGQSKRSTTKSASSRSKQCSPIVIDDEDSVSQDSASSRNQSETLSRSTRYENNSRQMEEEEDPFSFLSKRQKR